MSKQTAVEWLVEEIEEARRLCDDSTIEMDIWHTLDVLIKKSEQAKQMEKEQIEEAWDEGQECEYQYHINAAPKYNSNTYYNETFGESKTK